VLSGYLLEDLNQVWEITYRWLMSYNERCPYYALDGLPRRSSVNKKPPKTPLLNCLLDRGAYANRDSTQIEPALTSPPESPILQKRVWRSTLRRTRWHCDSPRDIWAGSDRDQAGGALLLLKRSRKNQPGRRSFRTAASF